jgi:methionine aminotransferase
MAEYFKDDNNYLQVKQMYQQKRDYFIKLLQGSRFRIMPTEGTYFQLLDFSNITDISDKEFAELLTKKHKIASIPVSAFYHDKHKSKVLRFCFAKGEETLEKAAEILQKI